MQIPYLKLIGTILGVLAMSSGLGLVAEGQGVLRETGSYQLLDQIKMVDEGQVADNGLRFTEFQFGSRITPHGDCIKVYGGYIFVTWYRGGMEDRTVMLSRKKIGGDTWRHIEFPHQHVMFRGDSTKGDSHNTIAIGISPKDDTIHLLYDMHAYTPSDFSDDYFNYSYSKKGAALVSDEDWKIDLFYPKQNYLNSRFAASNAGYYWRVTYPSFYVMENGDLLARWRIGGHINATMYLTKYDGDEWSVSRRWNNFDTTSGVYANFGIHNGRMHAAWSRRMHSDHDEGYINNRGIYYGYSNSEDGLSGWLPSDGVNRSFPIKDQEAFKVADPSEPGQRISRAPAFVITEKGAFHAHTQVDSTIKHYYRLNSQSDLKSSEGGPDGEMYSIGDRVYILGLQDGRPVIQSTEEGTHNWRDEFRLTAGRDYQHGNSVMVDGSIYFYLMEKGSGDQLPLRMLRFDVAEPVKPPPITPTADQTILRDTSTGPLLFQVFDPEVEAAALTVTGSSSDITLVPNGNIVIEGEGVDRTVTVTPAAGQVGETTITLILTGGAEAARTKFRLSVLMAPPPSITGISAQRILVNQATEALKFVLGHEVDSPATLLVSGASSNTGLIPDENILIEGEGTDRTVTVTPAQDWFGEAIITLLVEDLFGENSATSFRLTVEDEVQIWTLQAALTDLHSIRHDFGTFFPTPETSYRKSADGGLGTAGDAAMRNARSPIHGFALPKIDSSDQIENVIYTINLINRTNSPNWDGQLYLFRPDITPVDVGNPEDIFWASEEEDTREFVRPVDLQGLTRVTPTGAVSLILTGDMLEGFYDENGSPISADGKIWFRWSQGRKIVDGVERYNTQATFDAVESPSLAVNLSYPPSETFGDTWSLYTGTVILGAGRSHQTEWETVGSALRLNTSFWEEGFQQHTFTRTDVRLRVGYEWRAAVSKEFTGLQDIGLYVGAAHPSENVREDYVNIFMRNQAEGISVLAHGFAGTNAYETAEKVGESFDSLFIARTGPNTFDLGWYDGDTRKVLITRTTSNLKVGTAIGFYGDVRGAGIVGSLMNATVRVAPEILIFNGFSGWAEEMIPSDLDRTFGGSALGDGVANAIKYAFGLDPMHRALGGHMPSARVNEEGRLTLTYRVDMAAEGVLVVPEVGLVLGQAEWSGESSGGNAPYVSISEGKLVEGSVYEFTATAMNVENALFVFMRILIKSTGT